MTKNSLYPKNISELVHFIQSGKPLFITGSKTSTVVPFEQLGDYFFKDVELLSTEKIPKFIELIDETAVKVSGAVTWQELRQFLQEKGLLMLTSPTEELAQVLSGLATSATGERAFGFGTLRDQVKKIAYLGVGAEAFVLDSEDEISKHSVFQSAQAQDLLSRYQQLYAGNYAGFKNAPFPRLQFETDLMIGFEGQLGVITEAHLQVRKDEGRQFIFIRLDCWEKDDSLHLKLHKEMQKYRGKVIAFEMLDWNSYRAVPSDKRPGENCDLLFLEVFESAADEVIEVFMGALPVERHDQVFFMPESEVRKLRMDVPRYTFEQNSREGVLKIGTDAQVKTEQFGELLAVYRQWSQKGIRYNLFGHFGDSHLHFNFLPTKDQYQKGMDLLPEFYAWVAEVGGSPFAEHGIGLMKKKYMQQFYKQDIGLMFNHLKKQLDPQNQFFPNGFMSREGK